MNITEFMSFDLEWFTTLPGMLITGGVVVLLIALILFIASNKKDKNKSAEVAPVENVVDSEVQPAADNNFATGVAVGMMDVPVAPVDNNVTMNNDINGMNMMNNVAPVENSIPEVTGVNNPVVETPVVPTYAASAAATNVVDFSAPAVEPVAPVVPEVASPVVANEYVTPAVEQPAVVIPEVSPEVAPVVPEVVPVTTMEPVVSNVQEQPVIYGGANPTPVVSTPVQEKPVIYGGANPLENTTTLPRMVNNDAYGISNATPEVVPIVPEVPPVTPVEPITPVVEEQSPVVVEPSVPAVEEKPAVPVMPMTGAEMFASKEASISDVADASDEIETLEF